MKDAQASPWLHRLAVTTAVFTLFLIMVGALVVGNEAGLAVPDWPLSYGSFMPPMVGNIFYEHGHRMVATFVGLLTTILALWMWRAEPRRWMRRLGGIALLLVIAQGVLGGITVLFLLPIPVVVTHACLAQFFFCVTLSIAFFTSRLRQSEQRPVEDGRFPAFRHLAAATSAAIFVQLLLGAAYRHKGLILAPHLAGAAAVTFLVGWVIVRVLTEHSCFQLLRRLSIGLGGLLIVQLGLGGSSWAARMATRDAVQPQQYVVWITTLHVAVGALLLGTSWILTLWAFRRLPAPGRTFGLVEKPQGARA